VGIALCGDWICMANKTTNNCKTDPAGNKVRAMRVTIVMNATIPNSCSGHYRMSEFFQIIERFIRIFTGNRNTDPVFTNYMLIRRSPAAPAITTSWLLLAPIAPDICGFGKKNNLLHCDTTEQSHLGDVGLYMLCNLLRK